MSEQNKKNCGMARDLMPLSIDGICGENSQQFLDEHLQTCEECRDAYEKMKQTSTVKEKLDLDAHSTEEDMALAKSVKKTARRMKRRRWLIVLMIPVLLLIALFAVSKYEQYLMSIEKPLPMSTYDITLQTSNRYVALDLNIYNSPGGYMKTHFDYDIIVQETEDGPRRAAVITLTPTYCPYRDWYYNQGHIATFSLNGSYTNQFCAVDGVLYTINDVSYDYENPAVYDSDYTLQVKLGMPVMEIRVTDGSTTKTVYTWGSLIPELAKDSVHHFADLEGNSSSITIMNEATLWNTEVLITPEEMAAFPMTESVQNAYEVMTAYEAESATRLPMLTSTPIPQMTQIPMSTSNAEETLISVPASTQTPEPEDAE